MTGASLSDAKLYFASIAHTNLSGASLAGADLSHAGFESDNLNSADLTGANLDPASMLNVDLTGASFQNADLSLLDAQAVTGAPASLPENWQVIDQVLIGPGAAPFGATLKSANLSGLDLAGIQIGDADLTDANLSGADLRGATVSGYVTGADVAGTQLSGADLYSVISGGLKGMPASLPAHWSVIRGYLVGPGAALYNVNLAGIDLSGQDLAGVDFGESKLFYANLEGANLAHANMDFTQLDGADLFDANLSGVNWSNASCPNGDPSYNHGGSCSGARGYYFDGFRQPQRHDHIRKSAHSFRALFRLGESDTTRVTNLIGRSLASHRQVRVTLRGPGIEPVRAYCSWDTRFFRCTVRIPRNVKTGKTHRYTLTAFQNYGTGFKPIPQFLGRNPRVITFR